MKRLYRCLGLAALVSLVAVGTAQSSKTNDPNAGGLGISPAELMRTAKHYDWNPRHQSGRRL